MKVIFLQKATDEQGGSKASLRNTLRALSEQPDIEVELLAAAPGPLTAFAESLSIPVQMRHSLAGGMRWIDCSLIGLCANFQSRSKVPIGS
tara:strand:+ start:95 stop:367 length:273 start_codon:yes stop_codon:yes gene_type:complete